MDASVNENQWAIVKDYEFDKPDVHEIYYLLDDNIKDLKRNKSFHTFEYKFVYDIKFTNVSNFEEMNFTNIHRPMKFKSKLYVLNLKMKNARRNGFIFNQINNLTI